jgi:site-specific DNA-methyltransferase (adenine-specific)
MIEMLNCDCMDYMRELPDKAFELAIVDPPYGIGVDSMTLGNGKTKIPRGTQGWDSSAPTQKYFDELFRVSKNQIIWGGNYFVLPVKSSWIFWDKLTGKNDFSDGELAWTSFGGALRKYTQLWLGSNARDSDGRIHPTQKPVALYKWLLSKYAKPGDRILDTHGGSGSICIACHDLGYDLTWMELDTDYYNAAVKRYKNHAAQGFLIDPKEGKY